MHTYTYTIRHLGAPGAVLWESPEPLTGEARHLRQTIDAAPPAEGQVREARDVETGGRLYAIDHAGKPVKRLAFGLDPEGGVGCIRRVCWGARAIYGGRTVDLLGDRQDAQGTEADRAALAAWLDGRALPILRAMAAAGELPPRSEHREVRIAGEGYVLVCDPRGSFGYLYVGAWADESQTQALPTLAAINGTERRCRECSALPGRRHAQACRKAFPAQRRRRAQAAP